MVIVPCHTNDCFVTIFYDASGHHIIYFRPFIRRVSKITLLALLQVHGHVRPRGSFQLCEYSHCFIHVHILSYISLDNPK